MVLSIIKRSFVYLTICTKLYFYIVWTVRYHLVYCSCLWAPYRKGSRYNSL